MMNAHLRAMSLAGLIAAATFSTSSVATEVLVMDSNVVLNSSAVGEHIKGELAGIAETMNEELQSEGSPIQEEWDQFQAEIAPLDRAALGEREDLVARGNELQQKIVNLSVSERLRANELVATRAKALAPVREALDAVLEEIVAEKGADVLIERELLIFASDSVDVTQEVIEKLNAKLTSVDVERVEISLEDVQAAQAAAAAGNGGQ